MNKKRIIPILVIVVLSAIMLAAFAFFRDPQAKEKLSPIPVPERVASTTIPMKTYTSAVNGVSFSIPQSWEVVPGSVARIESPDFVETPTEDGSSKYISNGAAISFESAAYPVDEPEEYVSIIGELHDSPECGNCLTGHRIMIGGVPAHLGFASYGSETEPNGAIISFVNGGKRYRLLMSFAGYTPENQEILAEVIGTFSFTK